MDARFGARPSKLDENISRVVDTEKYDGTTHAKDGITSCK